MHTEIDHYLEQDKYYNQSRGRYWKLCSLCGKTKLVENISSKPGDENYQMDKYDPPIRFKKVIGRSFLQIFLSTQIIAPE